MGKKSWSWGRIVLHGPPLGENPFLDGLGQWLDSPEGELAEEAREVVWSLLDTAQIDVEHGTITWPEAKPLDIQQSVRRLHEDHLHLTEALIEDKVIAWLETEYAPDNDSSEQWTSSNDTSIDGSRSIAARHDGGSHAENSVLLSKEQRARYQWKTMRSRYSMRPRSQRTHGNVSPWRTNKRAPKELLRHGTRFESLKRKVHGFAH
jgi:hypothetical protein